MGLGLGSRLGSRLGSKVGVEAKVGASQDLGRRMDTFGAGKPFSSNLPDHEARRTIRGRVEVRSRYRLELGSGCVSLWTWVQLRLML